MKKEKLQNPADMIGVVINTEDHGNVKIISFNPHVEWGGLVNVYLDRPSVYTCVGSFLQ